MARYQVILAYDGTDFAGFQRQARARTVQGEVEAGLHKLGWQGRAILASGRTDTGVHASGQVIAFDHDWKHGTDSLQAALNASLPLDISARAVALTRPDFHPRYDAVSRCYRYCLTFQPVRDPMVERYAWRVWPAPSLEILQEAARLFVGTQDFAAFGTPPRTGGSTIRSVLRAGWQPEGERWVFEIEANAFLYHMVRHIVNAQVAAGLGRIELAVLRGCLQAGSPGDPIQGLAPAQGLVLSQVVYPPG